MYRDILVTEIESFEGGVSLLVCEPIKEEIPPSWLQKVEYIELLVGFRGIAVGQIA